jgi:hypothetical protein
MPLLVDDDITISANEVRDESMLSPVEKDDGLTPIFPAAVLVLAVALPSPPPAPVIPLLLYVRFE